MFKFAPFAPTLEGEFIFKNLVFIAVGWTLLNPASGGSFRQKVIT